MSTLIGTRVVRGPDWEWGNQDDGEGHVGTVVEVGKGDMGDRPEKTVIVMWDCGRKANYRVGFNNQFDLRIYDNAAAGAVHPDISCSACNQQGITGMRWKCMRCFNYNLCSPCFMNGSHEIGHNFQRFINRDSASVGKYIRSSAKQIEAKGMFPGALVQRGNDWRYGDQDGGDSNRPGHVINIQGWHDTDNRAAVGVRWPSKRNKLYRYRVGADGKLDVKCVQDGNGGTYYGDMLPKVGEEDALHVGDTVIIDFSKDTLKSLADARVAVNPDAQKRTGETGVITQVTEQGKLDIECRGGQKIQVNPLAVQKVITFSVGDKIRIIGDQDQLSKLQHGHGGLNETMKHVLGKEGRVERIYPDGDVRVTIQGNKLTFNPACLILVESGRHEQTFDQDPADALNTLMEQVRGSLGLQSADTDKSEKKKLSRAAAWGHVKDIQQILDAHPDWIDEKSSDRTPIQVAAHQGHLEAIKVLMKYRPSLEIKDNDGDTAIIYATYGNEHKVVEYLLDSGSYINAVNKQRRSCLHIAARRGYHDCVEVLLQRGCNCNMQDKAGDLALHDAIHKDKRDVIVTLVKWKHADLGIRNNKGLSVLHYAALRGNSFAAEQLVLHAPKLVNMRKDDGQTPLHVAASNNFKDVVEILIKKGKCALDEYDLQRQTPLLVAVAGGHVHIIELLIDSGADVNASDGDGDTCLHVAVMRFKHNPSGKDSEMLEQVRKSFNSTVINTPGAALLTYLIQKGAKVDLVNHGGKTALQLLENSRLEQALIKIASHVRSQSARPVSDHKSSSKSLSHVINLHHDTTPEQEQQQEKPPQPPTNPSPGKVPCQQEDRPHHHQQPAPPPHHRQQPPQYGQPKQQADPGPQHIPEVEQKRRANPKVEQAGKRAGFEGVHRIDVKEVELLEEIGSGSFAKVYKGRWRGTVVAVKRLMIEGSKHSEVEQEVSIHKRAMHPNIVQLMALGYNDICAMLVMSFIKGTTLHKAIFGELGTQVGQSCTLSVTQKNLIAKDVLCAVTYMHESGLLHLDIKPSNILLETVTLKPYLCDLGLSHIKQRAQMSLSSHINTTRGTVLYMAPEMHMEEKPKVTGAQDVWSIGCSFIEMYSECTVYPTSMTHVALARRIMVGDIVPESLAKVQAPHRDILVPCFRENPKERPSAMQLLEKFMALCKSS